MVADMFDLRFEIKATSAAYVVFDNWRSEIIYTGTIDQCYAFFTGLCKGIML